MTEGNSRTTAPEGADLVQAIGQAACDKKGMDILALDVRQLIDYTDYFVIVSCNTDRHVKAVWTHMHKALAEQGVEAISVEGQDFNRWVLLDFTSVMVHVFLGELRGLYELERLWADAPPVRLDLPDFDTDEEDFWDDPAFDE